MKNLLFIILLLPFWGLSQIKPIAGIEYSPNNNLRITGAIFDYPQFSTISGLSYDWKKLSFRAYGQVYMNHAKGINFSPKLAEYVFEASYKVTNDIRIKWKHNCFHPVVTRNEPQTYYYGGGDTFGVYYNFNK